MDTVPEILDYLNCQIIELHERETKARSEQKKMLCIIIDAQIQLLLVIIDDIEGQS